MNLTHCQLLWYWCLACAVTISFSVQERIGSWVAQSLIFRSILSRCSQVLMGMIYQAAAERAWRSTAGIETRLI